MKRPTNFDADFDAICAFDAGVPFRVGDAAELIQARNPGMTIGAAITRASLTTRYAATVALPDCPESAQLRKVANPRGSGRRWWCFVEPEAEAAA